MSEIRRSAPDDDTAAVLATAATEFGLALLTAMSSSIPLLVVLALVSSGRTFADGIDGTSTQAEIDALRRYVYDLGRRLRSAHDWTDARVQGYLRHPATMKLLATARDDFAVSQLENNLQRLAAVLVDRASRPDGPLDDHMLFARVARDIGDEGTRFLDFMLRRWEGSQDRIRRPEQEAEVVASFTSLQISDYLGEHKLESPSRAHALTLDLKVADRYVLITTDENGIGRGTPYKCRDGQFVHPPSGRVALTTWGRDFARMVRGAVELASASTTAPSIDPKVQTGAG